MFAGGQQIAFHFYVFKMLTSESDILHFIKFQERKAISMNNGRAYFYSDCSDKVILISMYDKYLIVNQFIKCKTLIKIMQEQIVKKGIWNVQERFKFEIKTAVKRMFWS